MGFIRSDRNVAIYITDGGSALRMRRGLKRPLPSPDSKSRHVLSRETESNSLSSGLNAMRVIVRLWPASGCPIDCQVCVSYTRTTACSGDVALHAVAMNCLSFETASEID